MKMVWVNTSLLKKFEVRFKEQGLTIASIITVVGMLMSTSVLAVTGGTGATGAAGGESKDFLQKQLKSLGRFWKCLAGKTGAALS